MLETRSEHKDLLVTFQKRKWKKYKVEWRVGGWRWTERYDGRVNKINFKKNNDRNTSRNNTTVNNFCFHYTSLFLFKLSFCENRKLATLDANYYYWSRQARSSTVWFIHDTPVKSPAITCEKPRRLTSSVITSWEATQAAARNDLPWLSPSRASVQRYTHTTRVPGGYKVRGGAGQGE